MWAKRRFKYAEFAPYQDILGELQMANAKICGQFIMVSVDTKDEPGESEYYVGVPNKAFLMPFVGFQQIQESELPREIDTLLLADVASEEFQRRFTFKTR